MSHTLGASLPATNDTYAIVGLPPDLAARLGSARPRLTRLARLRGVSADQAEDIVQVTLLTAWRTLARLRDPDRFDAWLDGILRNHCHYAAAREGEASIAALGAPALRSFMIERQRWIIEPETLITYDGAYAIRFSLYDFATGERLIYFADPQTLDLRGVHSA